MVSDGDFPARCSRFSMAAGLPEDLDEAHDDPNHGDQEEKDGSKDETGPYRPP